MGEVATAEQTTPVVEVELTRERGCAAAARHIAQAALPGSVRGQALDDVRLVVGELVTNAFLHGAGRIRMRLECFSDHVRVEVMDEGEGATIQIRRAGARDSGNGLRLVDHLALRWGAFEGSTHVWAELPVAAPATT